MLITKVHIEKFRGFHNQDFEVGSMLTAIAGQNGTQKSTLLGMITQTFTLTDGENPMYGEKPLCGGSYKSAFNDKFRLSPKYDKPKEHEWTLSFDDGTDFTIESISRTGSDKIRFWKKGARDKGDGYKQYPTIFLSLKRVLPIAESGTVSESNLLTEQEFEDFKKLHDKIFITESNIESASILENTNKQTIGITTNKYDWNENSVGQDNLGKIILALFSFRRLKEKYPNDYKGGILAIDELDATMYPASQKILLAELRKYASKLNLQIFFTTHSLSLLESVDDLLSECNKKDCTKDQVRLIFLKRQDENIIINDKATYQNITLNLQVIQGKKKEISKISVYTEDKETIIFSRYLLGGKASVLQFIDVDFSGANLISLVTKKVPSFNAPEAIVIVDGDVRKEKKKMKSISKTNNILILPTNMSPEQLTATFLHRLSDGDGLWESIGDGYSKQVCFKDYLYDDIMKDREKAKAWFRQEKPMWGRNAAKVLTPLFNKYDEDHKKFIGEFEEILKLYKT
jgi:predicted ATPase